MNKPPMTYAGAGVDYSLMDPFKRQAQEAAQKTAHYLREFDLAEVTWSRGESAYLIEMPLVPIRPPRSTDKKTCLGGTCVSRTK